MKLLNCLSCHNIQSITGITVTCDCGESRARLLEDGKTAIYTGYSRILEWEKNSYLMSMDPYATKYRKKKGLREDVPYLPPVDLQYHGLAFDKGESRKLPDSMIDSIIWEHLRPSDILRQMKTKKPS